MILFISIIGFINVMPKSYKSTVNKNMSFKKIESSPKNTVLFDSCTATSNNKHNLNVNVKTANNINKTASNWLAPNTMKDYMSPYVENSINYKSTISQSLL